MLTKLQKSILQICSQSREVTYDDLSILEKKYSPIMICSACKDLDAQGYFEFAHYEWNGLPMRISLNYKGLSFKEQSWLDLKQFLFQSLLVPFLVSLATTGTIWLIRYLLSLR